MLQKDLTISFVKNDWEMLVKIQNAMVDLEKIKIRKIIQICQVRQTNSKGKLRMFWRELLAHYAAASKKVE